MNKILWLLLIGVFFTLPSLAQTQVTGRVVSQDGSPIIGATVSVKNSKVSTVTDNEGNFRLSAPANSILKITYVGFQSVEVSSKDNLSIKLLPGENTLSEVVVVGYGTKLKKDITGSVARVSAKDIVNSPITSFENALQGRAAGVFVEQQGGKLGQGIKVRVRGSASVSAGNEPFYVVDGIPVVTSNLSSNGASTSPLADINPNDIESIEILKDASSAAIYGSRGSNGVVLITTKKGKAGKTKIDFGYYTGTQEPTRLVEFMNAEEYVGYFRQASIGKARQDFIAGRFSTFQASKTADSTFVESRLTRYSAENKDYETFKVNTDWQSLAFQRAPMSQYDLNLTGGSDKSKFYIGGQYLDQTGIILRNSLKRYSGRINFENTVSDRLTVGINMSFTRSLNKRISNDNAFSTPLQIVALSPITPAIDPRTGLTSGALDLATGLPNALYPVYYNPILSFEAALYNTNINRTFGNVYASLSLLKGLSFRSEFGMDQLNQNEESYNGRKTRRNSGSTLGTGFNSSDQILNLNTNNFLLYNTTLKNIHVIEATAGMSYQSYKQQSSSVSARDFPSDDFKKLASAAVNTGFSSTETQYSFLGYFARSTYKYNEKYIVQLSGRADASSRFGKNNRYGFFPAASVGWIATEEKFLSNVNWLNFLKVKASYGLTGNAEIGNFASRGLFAGDASYGGNPGIRATQIPNPDLKWELTKSTDIGIEATIFKNRISIEADYYSRKTEDLLLNVTVPGTSGFSSQLRNIGKLENKGFEFTLNTTNLVTENFKWTSNFNYSTNKNKITDLAGQVIGTINVAKEGLALGTFFTREFAGADPANGDALYYKNTVLADGKIDRTTTNNYNLAQDVVVGDPNPDYIYGFTNTFTYKGLELSGLLQGVEGNQIYGAAGQYFSASGSNGFDNQTKDQLAAWKNPGDITRVPEARRNYANGTNPSSRFIYSGSYLRLRSLTLSYTLPVKLISRFKVDRAKFYVRGQNLFTITKYPLWDPEVNADFSASNTVQGRDFYSVPQAKTIIFGVNISL